MYTCTSKQSLQLNFLTISYQVIKATSIDLYGHGLMYTYTRTFIHVGQTKKTAYRRWVSSLTRSACWRLCKIASRCLFLFSSVRVRCVSVVFIYTRTCAHTHANAHMYICVGVYRYVCECVCECVREYVWECRNT